MSTVFWEGFQSLEEDIEASYENTVAKDVLDVFGIETVNSMGGVLKNVDIKRADALSVLKASLLEMYAESNSSRLIEMCINEDGKALFYEVGTDTANIHPYYSIPASNYIRPKVGVLVTGGKPKQQRIVPSTGWYSLIGTSTATYSIFDTSRINTLCYAADFSTHAVITYRDPVRHKPNPNWNDGIEDVFELESPFDRFIGFTWRITPPEDLVTSTTKIYKQSQSSVPILISHTHGSSVYTIGSTGNFPNLGIPKKRTPKVYSDGQIDDCRVYEGGENYCSSSTVPINIPMIEGFTYDTLRGTRVSKFLGVQGVFIIGIPLNRCHGLAKPEMQLSENNAENTALFISSYSTITSVFRLNESIDYTLLYSSDLNSDPTNDGVPCIQFANNLRYNDHATIGTGVPFYIATDDRDLFDLFKNNVGVGSVLAAENNGGILVEAIYAQVTLDTPSFVVVDPRGNADKIANGLTVEILPLIFRDEPPPIAFNGKLIDQTDGIIDNDPTTRQSIQETEIERVYNDMGSGRTLSLNFTSLDEAGTIRLSQKLHDLLEDDGGVVYTYTCPPTDRPKLGQKGLNGGVINSIEYSYTDQGTYLITVVEGPECFGDFAGIDGDIYYKKTDESLSTQGTVIQDLGNHVQYVVHIDGMGPIQCINASANVISVRDRVSVTIHNNAVES